MGEAYGQLMSKMKEIETVGQIQGLLGWDQEVMMPPKAGPLRAEQLAWLSRTSHSMMVDSSMGQSLAAAEAEGADDEVAAGNLRLIRDAYDKATKKPADFVERFARHKSKSIVSWAEAREKNDFSIFRDDLAEMIALNRELAGYLGYEDNPYDALLDIYESGLCVAQVDPLFAGLREALVPLISAVGKCASPDMNWVESNHWPATYTSPLWTAIASASPPAPGRSYLV